MDGHVERRCKDCVFFCADVMATPYIGECRVRPPLINHTNPLFVGEFPRTHETTWCGEFKDKWQVRTERVDP